MWKPKIISRITWPPTLLSNSDTWKRVWRGLLYLVLPNTCCSCKRDLPAQDTAALCVSCRQAVRAVGQLYCIRCGKPLPDGGAHCWACRHHKGPRWKCSIIRSAVVFGPQVREVVHAFKYAGQSHWADYLAGWMSAAWEKYPDLAGAQVMMPVPLHPKKLKSRGYNQSFLLAQALARQKGIALNSTGLIRVRNTPSQTQFGREGRLQNMSGAFACIEGSAVRGKIVLLIDDVATTGATLEGCAQALKEAGAKKVIAYTLAREV